MSSSYREKKAKDPDFFLDEVPRELYPELFETSFDWRSGRRNAGKRPRRAEKSWELKVRYGSGWPVSNRIFSQKRQVTLRDCGKTQSLFNYRFLRR